MNMNFLPKKQRILTLLRHFYSYPSRIPNWTQIHPQTASKSDFTAFGTSWQPRGFQSQVYSLRFRRKRKGSINFGVGGNQRLFYLEHKKET